MPCPNPTTIQLAEGVLRFVVFGLSPILFPAEQLPAWLATLSWWLPLGHMAVIVRDSLAPEMVSDAPISYLMLAVWGVGCAAIAAWALGRRRCTRQRPSRRHGRPGSSTAPSACCPRASTSSALAFVVLLFSSIVHPPCHLPGWLFAIHQALPFYSMAVVIRAGLSVGLVSDLTQSFLVPRRLDVGRVGLTAWVIGRRRSSSSGCSVSGRAPGGRRGS
jgi:hypothetical protein